jgi:hypothetical protein
MEAWRKIKEGGNMIDTLKDFAGLVLFLAMVVLWMI